MAGPDADKHQPSGSASTDAAVPEVNAPESAPAPESALAPEAAPATETDIQSVPSHAVRSTVHRRLLWLTVAVATIWWLSLGSLAWRTANPVTFNLLQLRATDVVVAARIEDPQRGQIEVLHTWEFFPKAPADATVPISLKVEHLSELKLSAGNQLLIPLRRNSEGRFEVAPAVRPRGEQRRKAEPQRFVYPDSESARRLLEETRERLLDQARQRSQPT